jgi:hypothetical protein
MYVSDPNPNPDPTPHHPSMKTKIFLMKFLAYLDVLRSTGDQQLGWMAMYVFLISSVSLSTLSLLQCVLMAFAS